MFSGFRPVKEPLVPTGFQPCNPSEHLDQERDGRRTANRHFLAIIFTLALYVAAPLPAFAQNLFTPAAGFATGNSPVSVATGDFNGDGKVDLVVANSGNNTISVLLGNGDGTFQPAVTYDLGSVPEPLLSVAVGDFNGDGKLDIVAGSQPGPASQLTILLGNGDGTFQTSLVVVPTSTPSLLAVGDVNHDGKADLLVANKTTNTVDVLLGLGGGSFVPAGFLDVQGPTAGVIADFNHDGNQDLAVIGATNNDVTVFQGLGSGTFVAQSPVATGANPVSIVAGDFNGDGNLDLAVANRGGNNVTVLLGNGTVVFPAGVNFGVGTAPTSIAAGDFNGDGKLDLVVVNASDNTVSVLLNTTATGAATASFALQQPFSVGNSPASVAVADFNSDGKPDLGVANSGDNSVSVLLNNVPPIAPGNGLSLTAQQTFGVGINPFSLATADFNGDGKPDLVVANTNDATVSVLLNTTATGADAPSFATQVTFGVGANPESVAVGDFNGDGKPDLAVANAGDNTISVLLNTTVPGATTPSFAAQTTFGAGSVPSFVAVADFNGDGKPDLVVANSGTFASPGDTVSVLLNTTAVGAATPSFAAQTTFAVGSVPFSVAVADFNGDGLPDLVVTNTNDATVSVLLNTTAPGATTPSFATQQTFGVGSFPSWVAVGDFNGDGLPDLVVTNMNDATVSVLLNTTAPGGATPSFAAQQIFVVGTGPASVAVGDFNGDGRPDLVVANSGTFASPGDTVSVLLNTAAVGAATPSFAPHQIFAVGSNPFAVVAADFNGDGLPDLATANALASPQPATVSVLLNLGGITATILPSVNPSVYGQAVNLTATLAKALNAATDSPTGTVQFQDGDGGINLGPAVILSGSGGTSTAVLSTSSLGVGTHVITGLYNGDDDFWANTLIPIVQVVTQAASATAVGSSANPSLLGANATFTATVTDTSPGSVGTPTGTVTFKDGTTTLGTGALSGGVATFATSSLVLGPHSITAVYGGTANFAGSTSAVLTQTVNPKVTVTALASSLNPANVGNSVAFTATVVSAFGIPTGTVTFKDGSTTLGTGTLDADGNATYATSSLTAGSHSITASYAGANNFSSSTSAALAEVINPAGIVVNVAQASQTVTAGNSATYNLTVSADSTLSAPVSFACIGLPAHASCGFSPGSVNAGASGTPVTLTMSTTANTSAARIAPFGVNTGGQTASGRSGLPASLSPVRLRGLFGLAFGLPAIVLLGALKRRKLVRVTGLAVLMALLVCVIGCGSNTTTTTGSNGTPAGTYTVDVNSSSGTTQNITAVTLVVQ